MDLLVKLLSLELVIIVFTQKLAIPGSGDSRVQFAFVIHYGFLAIYALMSCIRLHASMFLFQLAATAAAVSFHALTPYEDYSFPSLFLYIMIYATLALGVPLDEKHYFKVLKNNQNIGMVVCSLVALDWLLQFAGQSMPNIEKILGDALMFHQFAYIQPLNWGAKYYKPNAIFFLETSMVAQFIAISLILEVCIFQRFWRIGAYAAALIATFGGTGMLVVALSAPLMLQYMNRRIIFATIAISPIVLATAVGLGVTDNIVNRATEFDKKGSSGQQRFVAPLEMITETLTATPQEAIFGAGAGRIAKGGNIMWLPIAKALKEYGLIFTVFWFGVTVMFFFGGNRPVVLSWALFVVYHLCNGTFVLTHVIVMCWLLIGGYHFPNRPNLQRNRSAAAIGGGPVPGMPASLAREA